MKRVSILILFCLNVGVIGNSIMPIFDEAYNKDIAEKKEITYTKEEIIRAIMRQESSDGKFIYSFNKSENAVGVLQIRPVMVRAVNQILGYTAFSLDDRLDSIKNIQMFTIFQNKHNPNMDFETACRIWNGGETAMKNKIKTDEYYAKINKHIKQIAKQ